MEIVVHGKTYRQDTVNFKTIHMGIQWFKRYNEEMQLLKQAFEEGLESNSIANQSQIDPLEDLEFTARLIVSFFDEQFTYDEFISGARFKSLSDLYAMAQKIVEFIYAQKQQADEQSKKPVTPLKLI